MAEECFRPTGLNPSQGFALMCIIDEPGVSRSEIAERLALAPSTITRVVEGLERRGLVTTTSEGRRVETSVTKEGRKVHRQVLKAWASLHEQYNSLLGTTASNTLCAEIHVATEALDKYTY
jgi:DNA-binding MarR family transcriptional regulator